MTADSEPYHLNADRRIWAIAGPAIVANSSAPLVGLVDTWVIGHLPGAVHLASVGVGAVIFSFMFWAFGFLRMSTTGLVAQAYGNKDNALIKRTLVQSVFLGLIFAGFLLVAQSQILWLGIEALGPPESTTDFIGDYFSIRIWSAPASLFIFSLTGYLFGTTQAKAALWLQLILNISNGILNLIFVLGFDMGVSGIALGSVLAEWIAALFGVYLLGKNFKFRELMEVVRDKISWRFSQFNKLLSANMYIFLRTLVLMTALALITRNAAVLGEEALGANLVLMNFLLLISLGLDAFAHAAEAFVGAAYGKGNRGEMRFWIARTSLWAGVTAVLYSLVFLVAGQNLINILTNIEEVRTIAAVGLPVMVLMPIFAVWCYQFDGIFIGVTSGRGMLITMIAAFAIYLLVLNPLTTEYGFKGLWIAVLVFMASRGLMQALYYPLIERKMTKVTQG
ncbi:MAG: MATE family efflux transporter [Kordiimonadaceae bacterium]|nr:MATE family efflux transporter [Kordiimonadaceae bacterium]